jgi:hypothetical protein
MTYKPRCTNPKANVMSRAERKRHNRELRRPGDLAARLERWLATKDLSIDTCPVPSCAAHLAFKDEEFELALVHGALLTCTRCHEKLVLKATDADPPMAYLAVATPENVATSAHKMVQAEEALHERAMAGDPEALKKIFNGRKQ